MGTIFFLNVFYLKLVDSVDVEPVDLEAKFNWHLAQFLPPCTGKAGLLAMFIWKEYHLNSWQEVKHSYSYISWKQKNTHRGF
jgi:hypothetical protein